MKKRLLKLTLMFLLVTAGAYAQQVVTGKITSALDGSPLPGVSILIKGTSSGTTTDANGSFSLKTLGASDVLVVSFIGFTTQEVAVANRSTIDLVMAEDAAQLGDVVVTALGIEREKKALGYSVQEVSGQNFQVAREANVVNNLQGRVAGVQIYKGGTGPGGSSRIVIRGSNSLSGDDAPLFVVDGVPFDSYNTANGQSEYGSSDSGQGFAAINPDDIETMTVLKGPEGGALYGNRGANGVILITTKKGTNHKGIGVTYNNNVTFDSPLLLPKLQNVYGQGSNGVFNINSESSWGPKATGQSVLDWTGKQHAQTIDPKDINKFLNTGRTLTNSISLAGGDEKTTVRFGYTNFDNKGLLPTSSIKRNMASLRATTKLSDRISIDVKVSYSKQDGHNRPQTSGSPSNVFSQYSTMPRSVHLSDMKPWKDAAGGMILWKPSAYSTLRNPYWTLNEDFNNDENEKLLSMVKLDYKITDWLKLFVRHGMDQSYAFNEGASAYGIRNPADSSLNFQSGYSASVSKARETNGDFLVTAAKTFGDFSFSLSGGGNRRTDVSNSVSGVTNTLLFPGLYTLNIGANPRPGQYKSMFRTNSLYAFMNVSFKNAIFVDATFRNDWVSSGSVAHRSFYYPSISSSAVISELVTLPQTISYLKVRAGYAQTGKAIDPYSLTATYDISPGFNNAQTAGTPGTLYNSNILPQASNSYEVGLDMKLFGNRVSLEAAYYDKSVKNQIVYLPIPGATGYSNKVVNAGQVSNKGIEFVLGGSPIKTSSLEWNIQVNFNHNVNKVSKLIEGAQRYFLQGDEQSRAVRIVADEGRPMGDIYGRDFLRNAQGQVIIDPTTGLPEKDTNKNTYLGNYQPRYTLGVVNSVSFKNFTLGFLIDARVGGKLYSQSLAYETAAGSAAQTLAYRDGGMIVKGVNSDGSSTTKAINAQDYWTYVGGSEPVASLYIYSATNVRLREATLTYNLPASVVGKTPFTRLSFGLVGRNLWLISNHLPGVDVESTFSVTNAQGVENGAYPSLRSYGFNLNLGL